MVEEHSRDAFTCQVRDEPYLQCLDLTSHNNGAVVIRMTEDGYVDITANTTTSAREGINGSYYGSSISDIFGQSVECDGKVVGDGMLNVFDLALLLKYMVGGFEDLLPQDPTAVTTGLQGRTDLHKSCGGGMTLWEYKAEYEGNPPYSNCWPDEPEPAGGSRRRLVERSPGPRPSPLVVHTRLWLAVPGKGAWYQLTLGEVHKSAELQIKSILWPDHKPRQARLLDDVYPWDGLEPTVWDEVQARYAHHCEYSGSCKGRCSVITPVLSNQLLIVEDTLAYTLGETNGKTVLCGVDFYIWVPGNPRYPRQRVPDPCVTFATAQPTRATTRASATCGSEELSTTGGEAESESAGNGSNAFVSGGSPLLPPARGASPPSPGDILTLASPPAADPSAVDPSKLAPPPPPDLEGGSWWLLLLIVLLASCSCGCLAVAAFIRHRRRNAKLVRVHPGAVGKRHRLVNESLAAVKSAVRV